MPHNLNLNPGTTAPVAPEEPEEKGLSTQEKLFAVGDFFSTVGAALEGKRAPESGLRRFRDQQLQADRRKQEQLVFEQQQFVSKMTTMSTFMDLRKSIPESRRADFDKQAVSFIGDTDKRFGELYHFATEGQGNTEIIGDLLGGGFEQDQVLQTQLANLGPSGFIDWTLGDGKAYITQLKNNKFGPSAKAKVGSIVSDLKSNIPDNLFKKITKDGLTDIGEIDLINTHLVQSGNPLALSEAEAEFLRTDEGINSLQGMGITSTTLTEKLIEAKRKKQLEAQFRAPKDKKSNLSIRGPVLDKRTNEQVGVSVFNSDTNRMGVLLPGGEIRERDTVNEIITSRVEITAEDVGTKKEVVDFRSQEVATRSFFDITDSLFEVLDKSPESLGNAASAASFLTGVKVQVQSAANILGADFDVSADPEDYSGIFKELGLVGADNAAVRSYLTSLAFAGAAAQGLGQKNIDSAKEMERLLRQIGANAQSIPQLKKAIGAFQNTLRIRIVNTAQVLDLPFDVDGLQTPEEKDEIDALTREIEILEALERQAQ